MGYGCVVDGGDKGCWGGGYGDDGWGVVYVGCDEVGDGYERVVNGRCGDDDLGYWGFFFYVNGGIGYWLVWRVCWCDYYDLSYKRFFLFVDNSVWNWLIRWFSGCSNDNLWNKWVFDVVNDCVSYWLFNFDWCYNCLNGLGCIIDISNLVYGDVRGWCDDYNIGYGRFVDLNDISFDFLFNYFSLDFVCGDNDYNRFLSFKNFNDCFVNDFYFCYFDWVRWFCDWNRYDSLEVSDCNLVYVWNYYFGKCVGKNRCYNICCCGNICNGCCYFWNDCCRFYVSVYVSGNRDCVFWFIWWLEWYDCGWSYIGYICYKCCGKCRSIVEWRCLSFGECWGEENCCDRNCNVLCKIRYGDRYWY